MKPNPAFKKSLLATAIAGQLFTVVISGKVSATEVNGEEESDEFGFSLEETSSEEPQVSLPTHTSTLELGATYTSDDNSQFGKYNGYHSSGWQPLLQFNSLNAATEPETFSWEFDVRIGNEDNQSLLFKALNSDGLFIKALYQNSTSFGLQSGTTPFINPGSDDLKLPNDWLPGITTSEFGNLFERQHEVHLEQSRERLLVNQKYRLTPNWDLLADVQTEKKTGLKTTAGAIYFNAANGHSVILPEPIDSQTHDMSLGLGFHTDNLQVNGSYRLALFDNHVDRLQWQNPYDQAFSSNISYPNGLGAIDSAPDNQFQQARLSGNYQFSPTLRLQWDSAYGLAEQDEDFEPYTVNESLLVHTPLPVQSLTGEVETSSLHTALLLQPLPKLSLEARYRYDARDNNSPRNAYLYVRGDGADQPATLFSVYNVATGHEKQNARLDAHYRLPSHMKLSIGYGYEQTDRRNAAVSKTEDDVYRLGLRAHPHQKLTTEFSYEYRDRTASDYHWAYDYYAQFDSELINLTPDNERYTNHPELRQFHLANREDDTYKLRVNVLATERINFNASALWQQQHYDKSSLGLRKNNLTQYNFQANFAPTESLNYYLYANLSSNDQSQNGWQFLGGADKAYNDTVPPLTDASDERNRWAIESADKSRSFGAGVNHELITDVLALTLDYVYVKTSNEYDSEVNSNLADSSSINANAGLIPRSSTQSHQLGVVLDYQFNPQTTVRCDYHFYRYKESDWGSEFNPINTLDKVLLQGEEPRNEKLHAVTGSVIYQF